METNTYQSDLAIHPGEYLEEVLEDAGMSQAELSKRIGRPTQAINEIIKGKKSITPATAIELEDVLKVSAHIWVGLEAEYQMVKAKQAELRRMEEESSLLSNFPYTDLVNAGFVRSTRNPIEKVDELRSFFAVAQLSRIEHVGAYQSAFRVTNHKNISHESIASWIQAGRLSADTIKTAPFDKVKLKKALPELKTFMNMDINSAIEACRTLLASCGVAFVLLPHFKNTGVNGATFWINNREKAVVMMSLRGKSSDIFWFSFFHEIAHVLLHNKREMFLEDGYNTPELRQQECEADEFARDFLIPMKEYQAFVMAGVFTKEGVNALANALHIKTSIIVGRLMYEKIIPYNHSLRREIDKYEFK
ncbi:MAG: HigA family addiction module antitoxin [Campylobacterota bacterium]